MSLESFVTDGPLLLAAPVAVAAGLVSFLSPCVLPLVPGYLSYVAGLSGRDVADAPSRGQREPDPTPGPTPGREDAAPRADDASTGGAVAVAAPAPPATAGAAADAGRRRVAVGTVLFVLGFSVVFVSYGTLFGSLGRRLVLHQRGLAQILGTVTILLGLMFAGLFARVPLANRQWRPRWLPAPGLAGAPLLGVLFGVGWTPCIGPTLAAVNGLALQSATAGRGAALSAFYCLGLGVPFVLVGLAVRWTVGALAAVRRHARGVAVAGGLLLVVVGVLQVTGAWDALLADVRQVLPGFQETPL
jgi:cytochrome c-type biogenesis protein